ncbi:MAG TPA: DUF167 domain-containing protein [archaeon]|nr:DUF167 domain-containing protein [archaeon]
MIIEIRVKPNSSSEKISLKENILLVNLKAPAEKGKANRALVKFLSKVFGSARIASGETSRKKFVEIPQENLEEIKRIVGSIFL